MPSALVFGGSGKVARILARILAKEHTPAYTVYSVIRNPAQTAELEALGATPVVQSIEDSSLDDLVALVARTRPSAVIWSAGAGGGSPARTVAVDRDGAIRVMDAVARAAERHGTTRRFLLVSAIDVRDRDARPAPAWYTDADRAASDRGWAAIGTYMQAKLEADRSLRTENGRRGLAYTILRPGALSLEPGTGRIRAGKIGLGGAVPREDVARVLVAAIENEDTAGLAFDFLGEGDGAEEIDKALERVVEAKEDTFEGYY